MYVVPIAHRTSLVVIRRRTWSSQFWFSLWSTSSYHVSAVTCLYCIYDCAGSISRLQYDIAAPANIVWRAYGTPNLTKLLSPHDSLCSRNDDLWYHDSSRLDRFKSTWPPQVGFQLSSRLPIPSRRELYQSAMKCWCVVTIMKSGKGR